MFLKQIPRNEFTENHRNGDGGTLNRRKISGDYDLTGSHIILQFSGGHPNRPSSSCPWEDNAR